MKQDFYSYHIRVEPRSRVIVERRDHLGQDLGRTEGLLRYSKKNERLIQAQISALNELPDTQRSPQAVTKLGNLLFETLFDTKLRHDLFRFFDERINGSDSRLRMSLEINRALDLKLAGLPWEFLTSPLEAEYGFISFGTDSNIAFSRRKSISQVPRPIVLAEGEQLRIALVVSAPDDLDAVKYEEVWESMQKLAAGRPDRISLIEPLKQPNPVSLDMLLKQHRPHILHFVGHGRLIHHSDYADGELALTYARIEIANWCGTNHICSILNRNRAPNIIFLHACQGAAQSSAQGFTSIASRLVDQNIPVVIAMQYPVSNLTAQTFAQAFYDNLLENNPVDLAVQEGRRTISNTLGIGSRDFATPVLYMRDPDGFIFANNHQDRNIFPKTTDTNELHSSISLAASLHQIQLAQELPPQSVSQLLRLAEDLGSLSDEQWNHFAIYDSIRNTLTQNLQYYDNQLQEFGEDETNKATQRIYSFLYILDQISAALRLAKRMPYIAGGILRRFGRRSFRNLDFSSADDYFERAKNLIGEEYSLEYAYLLRDWAISKLHNDEHKKAFDLAKLAENVTKHIFTPNKGEFYHILALSAFENDNENIYRNSFDDAIYYYRINSDKNRVVHISMDKILTLIYKGHSDIAIDEIAQLENILIENNEIVDLLFLRAMALIDCNNPGVALECIDNAFLLIRQLKDQDQFDLALECKMHAAKLDAHLNILRQMVQRNDNSVEDYFRLNLKPAYNKLCGRMRELGHDGIASERVDAEVFWGEANLLIGKKAKAKSALEKAAKYLTESDEHDIASSRIQYILFKARYSEACGNHDIALDLCQEAWNQAQAHPKTYLLQIPALLLRAEIALSAGNIDVAIMATQEAQDIIQEGISPHRIHEVESMLARIQTSQ